MNNCEVHKTTILVIHEIYGVNSHIKDICDNLEQLGFTVVCPNLLGKVGSYSYKEENNAYRHFVNEVGFELAADRIITIAKELRTRVSNLYILGFSVGATVAWLCSNRDGLFDGAIGFYGSRIRDYLDVIPKCETLLFFPTKEKSFNPEDIINKLKTKAKTQVVKVKGEHGFTDKLTPYYNKYSSELCFQKMYDFIFNQNKNSESGVIK